MFTLTQPVNFPVGGNQSARRKPTTFGRVLTHSFHMSRALGSSNIEKVLTEVIVYTYSESLGFCGTSLNVENFHSILRHIYPSEYTYSEQFGMGEEVGGGGGMLQAFTCNLFFCYKINVIETHCSVIFGIANSFVTKSFSPSLLARIKSVKCKMVDLTTDNCVKLQTILLKLPFHQTLVLTIDIMLVLTDDSLERMNCQNYYPTKTKSLPKLPSYQNYRNHPTKSTILQKVPSYQNYHFSKTMVTQTL